MILGPRYLLTRCLDVKGIRKCFIALYGLIIVQFSLGVNRKYKFFGRLEAQVPLAREMSIPSSSSLTVELTCEEAKILTKLNQHACHYKHNLDVSQKRCFLIISKPGSVHVLWFSTPKVQTTLQFQQEFGGQIACFHGQFLLPSLAPSFRGCQLNLLRDADFFHPLNGTILGTQTERSQDVCWRWYFVSGKLATLPGPYKSPAPPWVWVALGGRKENWVAWSKLEANPRNFMENTRRSPPLIHGNIMKPL